MRAATRGRGRAAEEQPRSGHGQPRNAHGIVESVTRGLWIAGWGGATAPFEYKSDKNERKKVKGNLTAPRASYWSAFPYDEAEYKKRQGALRKALARIPPGDATILLTRARGRTRL